MNVTLIIPMREYFDLKDIIHGTDTPTYMEALSGEHADEYHKAIYNEIHSLIRSDTWKVQFSSRKIFLKVQE